MTSHSLTEDTKIIDRTPVVHPRTDKYIWGIYIGLVIISLIELYSASSREVTEGHILTPLMRHAGLLAGGFALMVMLQRVHYRVFYKLTWLIVGVSILATVYTMFFGIVINGARRAFSLGICTVQPSELLKFSIALLIARVLGDGQIKKRGRADVSDKSVIIVAVAVLVFSALLVKQGLTNTILLMAISLSMMLIGGVSWKKFLMVFGIYAVLGLGYGVYSSMRASDNSVSDETQNVHEDRDRSKLRKERLLNFFNSRKYADPITSDNQQEQFSFIAQANGGIFGVGPGNSRETARLPLAFSDYIYAIVVEDIGLFGGLVVMALYLLLLARAGRVASQCKKAFPALLIIGMAVFIVFQALFHMAIVTGFFPVSGQPLPLISKGGSSVIISSIALGIMLSVSRFADRKGVDDEAGQVVDDPGMADNPTQL